MAKKYHQSVKDRMAESRGMVRHDMGEAMEHYAGYDARRRREIEDGNMLNENHSAIANMPQEVKYHNWPSNPFGARYRLNDSIVGIDVQIRDDMTQEKDKAFPEKY